MISTVLIDAEWEHDRSGSPLLRQLLSVIRDYSEYGVILFSTLYFCAYSVRNTKFDEQCNWECYMTSEQNQPLKELVWEVSNAYRTISN